VRKEADATTALLRGRPGVVRVKVCCIASEQEASLALEAGADALGLVSAMPSGPGVIADEAIASITRFIGSRAATVLLTSRRDAARIGEQIARFRPTVVQICDVPLAQEYGMLRRTHPDVMLMQVVHVRGEESLEEASAIAPHVDAILLDSGNPSAAVKELGGTGRVHDWKLSRAIRNAAKVPIFLAGGLKVSNVADAIATVQPFGVDVCSGVRVNGRLDRDAVHAFVRAARGTRGTS
jgi:phosphoribosylanthranilate isomerase